MAHRTASVTGLRSDTATWGGAAPPVDGDTWTINAGITVTNDSGIWTFGTSPNNNTTIVGQINGFLVNAVGATVVCKGNIGIAFDQLLTNHGTWTFDNSGSGGSPVYEIALSLAAITCSGTFQAISGQTWNITGTAYAWPTKALDFTTGYSFTRKADSQITVHPSAVHFEFTGGAIDNCGRTYFIGSGTGLDIFIRKNTVTNTTHASECYQLGFDTAKISGTREFVGNKLDKGLTYAVCKDFIIEDNTIPGTFTNHASSTHISGRFKNNLIKNISGDGSRINNSLGGNFWWMDTDNSHYLALYAETEDVVADGEVFYYGGGAVTDDGEIFLYSSGGFRAKVRNCVFLKGAHGYMSAGITLFGVDADRKAQIEHCTFYARTEAVISGVIRFAEGTNGVADELELCKSNIFFSDVPGEGLKASRQQGTVNGIITATGWNNNAWWNLADGDNGLGMHDFAGDLDLYIGGAANGGNSAAAGIDANGLNQDGQLVDPFRNPGRWAQARGYGTTDADAMIAILADPSPGVRIADMIAWHKAGQAPQNPSFRNAGSDGRTIGAVEAVAQMSFTSGPGSRPGPFQPCSAA